MIAVSPVPLIRRKAGFLPADVQIETVRPSIPKGHRPRKVAFRLIDLDILPTRLAAWLDPAHERLDGFPTAIYRTAMNKTRPDAETQADADHRGGATLYGFLEVAERLFERVSTVLGVVGLSYAKYEVLQHLSDAGGPVSLGTLAVGQHCARSNITQLVDRLQSEGMVRRVDDPDDRRSVRAELTPLGTAKAAEGREQLARVRAEFAACFTAEERAELGRMLRKVR